MLFLTLLVSVKTTLLCYTFYNMAKISYQLIDPEYEEYFKKALSPSWRFELPRIMRTERFVSRAKRVQLTKQSYFSDIGVLWKNLSSSERESWNEAGAITGLSGWHLFVQDTTIRIKRGYSGVGTPSLLHQSWVGHLKIDDPASSIELIQPHPAYYWISRIVSGRYPLTEIVWIHEDFSLPLKIGLSYSSNLESTGAGSYAKFFARVWSSYQGVDRYTDFEIPFLSPLNYTFQSGDNYTFQNNKNFPFIATWNTGEKTINRVTGHVISYELFFKLYNVRGDLFFDNLIAEHSGANWVRDPSCNKIEAEFSKSFFQVLRNWIPIDVPTGASFFSDYID